MDATPRNVNDRPHLNELGDVLRPAVEQVRMQALPQEALSRSLGRARALGPPPVKFWRRPEVRMLATAAAAALVVAVLSVWARHYITGMNQLAPLRLSDPAEQNQPPGSEDNQRIAPERDTSYFPQRNGDVNIPGPINPAGREKTINRQDARGARK